MDSKESLLQYLDKLHTTELGADRIKKNLGIDVDDIISWCKDKISNENCQITCKGKNWYADVDNSIFTINAHSYTIITAHKVKS